MNAFAISDTLIISVDWLDFTVKDPAFDIYRVMEFLGFDRSMFVDCEHGARGYKNMCKLSGYEVSILSDGQPDMGIHVSISGSDVSYVLGKYAASQYCHSQPFSDDLCSEDFNSDHVLQHILRSIREIGNVTRLDLALDDKKPYFTPAKLNEYCQKGCLKTKFRSARYEHGFKPSSYESTGDTIYLGKRGSKGSGIFLRVYDKQLEHNSKNPDDLITEPWIRWEFEITDTRANAVADLISASENIGDVYFGILNNYISLIDTSADQNRSRCPMLPEWSDFIEHVKPLHLYCIPEPKTLADKENWLVSQCAPTFGLLSQIKGLDYAISIIESGCTRIKKSDWELASVEMGKRAMESKERCYDS